jgi:phosphomannomutase
MKNLMVTVSGVRGVIGESFTPEIITKYARSFAEFIGGNKIVLGTDSRVSREYVKSIVGGVLVASGYEVIDLGIVPTPTVQFMVEKLEADAGIVITASHNPIEWNGLKFIEKDGLFLRPKNCEIVYKNAEKQENSYKEWENLGKMTHYPTANEEHIQAIMDLSYINPEKLHSQKLKIVIDTINGAGGKIMKLLVEKFGAEIVMLNEEQNGKFSRSPEPIPENLTELMEKVKTEKADLGIAVDPDVDRCVFIDENGQAIGEEYTLGLATKFFLKNKLGAVVKNLSSSRVLDDLAIYYNCPSHSAAVGEINVAEKMIEVDAVIGGEGNGGVMLPDLHIGRDAPVAAALVLQHLANEKKSLSEAKADLPQYEIVKLKTSIEGLDPDKIIKNLKEKYKNEKLNTIDGLKIDAKNYWVHLRKSNTEPIMRVIAEAKTKKEALNIANKFIDEISVQ